MKVICIDNTPSKNGHAILLNIGDTYNVSQADWEDSYFVDGLLFDPRTGYFISFKKFHFAPLSSISETEFERNYNFKPVEI